jgi:hypothetical protein
VKQIQFKNTSISYSDTGKGTAIVLLHGFLENQNVGSLHSDFFKKTESSQLIYWVMEKQNVWAMFTMEDNADAVHSVLSELAYVNQFVGILWVVMCWLSPNCTLNM